MSGFIKKKFKRVYLSLLPLIVWTVLLGCSPESSEEWWNVKLKRQNSSQEFLCILKLQKSGSKYEGELSSYQFGDREVSNIRVDKSGIAAMITLWEDELNWHASITRDSLIGTLKGPDIEFEILGARITSTATYQPPDVEYTLLISELPEVEKEINHQGLVRNMNREGFVRGERIYNSNCINCHGSPEHEGSIPLSLKFWEGAFKAGNDPYSMYQAISRGFATMPPQLTLTPQQKYDVISYIREEFVAEQNKEQYFQINPGYLASIPPGNTFGPDAQPYHPWADMDYGNFLINTYELADSATGPPRYHSPRPVPYADENYLKNNFAYKGIAVRLDQGPGGVSAGRAWMIFDHDVLRVAGGWTGEGFIDWNGILLNDKHETYPRNIGKLHFETPVGPGWANPKTGSFEDPRFKARDGRHFGPLPKPWADYKGLYHFEDKVVIRYSVGDADILELPGMIEFDGNIIFTRTMNISPSSTPLKTRVATSGARVAVQGSGAKFTEEDGYQVLNFPSGKEVKLKIFIGAGEVEDIEELINSAGPVPSLSAYTKGGKPQYNEEMKTMIENGSEAGAFAVDKLTPPFDNPWKSRMKLSGIDFFKDANQAAVCTTDGDVWTIVGLTDGGTTLTWKRIATGLFQPLGIKVVDEKIYVICRDQLVRLDDLNGDGETDYYYSFNHDHQVTDHFHEFAMGLQTDPQGNFYYAKSGRHARESLIPQHGTLIKVSKDGFRSEIIATGFRAANGVCINPDGTFLVTDQQGFWNPMNRINWIEGKGKFYGNMWGYNPPKDTSRAAMEPPAVWVDMKYDRSPSELLWVDSEQWGPLNGALLSLSYGYGKIQLVLHEKVKGQRQAGVIDFPGVSFMTGVMRGRFNPEDQQLYTCGMSAWGTNQMIKGGGLYRVRYTGKPLTIPVGLSAQTDGVQLEFAKAIDKDSLEPENFNVQTWDIVRSSRYGSERYNIQTMEISDIKTSPDGKKIKLIIPDIKPIDIMTIDYDIVDAQGNKLAGSLQNTIHNLKSASTLAMTHDQTP
ncbi:MAG: DUF6797 domain-containing protein [Cyclobacteriaceae bacterium]